LDLVKNKIKPKIKKMVNNKGSENNLKPGDRILSELFSDSAERYYDTLTQQGYSKGEINLIDHEEKSRTHLNNSNLEIIIGTKAKECAGGGAIIGGLVGLAIGIIAAAGTQLALPGLNLIIPGSLIGGLASAGAGAATGSLMGALVGYSIPEDKTRRYERELKNGKIIFDINVRNREELNIFKND